MMNYPILATTLCMSIALGVHSQDEIGAEFFSYLMRDALILSNDKVLKGESEIKEFIFQFNKFNGGVKSYQKNFSIEVNDKLDYEVGDIQSGSLTFATMFLKRKDVTPSPAIELLVIYKKENAPSLKTDLDDLRAKWMQLCNNHQVADLVRNLYSADAYYYSRQGLLQGTEALTSEYNYMGDSSYSLQLTPKHLAIINPEIVFEIGRCSGSYPNPYMLLWKRQTDGGWKILMDSNY